MRYIWKWIKTGVLQLRISGPFATRIISTFAPFNAISERLHFVDTLQHVFRDSFFPIFNPNASIYMVGSFLTFSAYTQPLMEREFYLFSSYLYVLMFYFTKFCHTDFSAVLQHQYDYRIQLLPKYHWKVNIFYRFIYYICW